MPNCHSFCTNHTHFFVLLHWRVYKICVYFSYLKASLNHNHHHHHQQQHPLLECVFLWMPVTTMVLQVYNWFQRHHHQQYPQQISSLFVNTNDLYLVHPHTSCFIIANNFYRCASLQNTSLAIIINKFWSYPSTSTIFINMQAQATAHQWVSVIWMI